MRAPAVVELDEIEEAGNGRDDGVTAMEAEVELFGAETKVTEVETAIEDEDVRAEHDKSVSGGEAEQSVGEEESTEALLTTVAVTIEPTGTSRRVSFPRLRHEPRLGAASPLKSGLKKPLASVVDWTPSEDAEIEVGETVYAAWMLMCDPEEMVVREVEQEVVEAAVGEETATVSDLVEVVSDSSLTEETSEASCYKEEYDKELEERLVPLDEMERKRQMKVNAETRKDPSLEDMVKYLGIPEKVLERVSASSASRLKRPEYWQEWVNKTLGSSAEATELSVTSARRRKVSRRSPSALRGEPLKRKEDL
ncbi:hypothetical protein PInf_014669 [Phytophthora infestans]|nr:hypothetical protein PInf_014669 [Phytophthora infestans]